MSRREDRKAYKAVVRCLNDLENGRVHHGENGDIAPWQDNIDYFRAIKWAYEQRMALEERQNEGRAVIAVLLVAFVCALIFCLWTL